MQTDPADPAQGAGDPGTGATGSPDLAAENARLKEDNAKAREELRQSTAKTLGTTHGLTPTQIELLSQQPRDKQEEIAKKLGEETKAAAGAGAAAPAGDPAAGTDPAAPAATGTPAAEPADAAALASMAAGGEQPQGGAVAPTDWRAQMDREVAEASAKGDFDAIQAIQSKYKRISRDEDAGRV